MKWQQAHTPKYFGILAEFESPTALYKACENVRDAGFKHWDAHTPFPVHGLEKAMGLPASKVPWVTLVAGLTGAFLGFAMQWWVNVVDYPIVISGKPHFSWPAFVPVTFELGVLFGAAGAILSMLAFNGLPRFHHPLFQSERFERVTDDKFFISIESADPQFDPQKTAALLSSLGAVHTELIEH